MKKLAIATALAMAVTTASALEIGVTETRDYSGADRNFGGVTIGQSFGKNTITLGGERSNVGDNDQNRYSLVGGHDLVKMGPVTLGPRAGVVYLNNQIGENGYAITAGVSATMPVTKQVSFGLAVDRQYGQDRVEQFDGNRVTVSAKYRF